MNNPAIADQEPWYRQFYVWLIIFLPACAVAASFATLYVAAMNPPDLVVDDYAGIEATVARNAAQDSRATALGLRASMSFGNQDSTGTALDLRLLTRDPQVLPSTVLLRVVHSTQAAQDSSTELRGTNGRYAGSIKLPAGNYDIFLGDTEGTWRLTTRVAGRPPTLELHAPGLSRAATQQQ
jgi:hypothetical protein